MKDAPKVTVLMPVYNGEKYVKEAMDSILNQTFSDFEFLVIDDGSTDQTFDIVDSYKDERIRTVRWSQNMGLVHSLNCGIEMARGEYIARMDCDDISMPDRLKKQVVFMDRHAEVGICGTWVRFFPKEHSFVWKLPIKHERIVSRLLFDAAIAHPSVIIRKEVLLRHNLRYKSEFKHAEDYDLWVRAGQCTRLANIPRIMLCYRISQSHVCHVHNLEQRKNAGRIRENQLNLLGIFPDDAQRKLHESLARCEFSESHQYVDIVEDWLMDIREANLRMGVFSEPFFSERLADIWSMVCLNAALSGRCSFTRMRGSPLFSASGVKNKGLLLARWIVGTRAWMRS